MRRDNSLAAKGMVKNLISFLLKERDVRKAVESVDRLVHSLMDDTIDRAELVISKGLSKRPDDPVYVKTQAHARLARKMEKRNPATAPKLGDRVPYIIIDKGNKAKNLEKAEDPIYVLEHDIPIDKNYYIEHQLRQPFERILEPILPGITEAMFSRHSSTIYLPPKGASIAVQREPEFVPRSKLPAPQNQLGLSASRKKSRKPLPGQLTLFSTDQMDLGLSRKPVGPPAKKPAAKGGLTKAQIKKYAPPPGQVDLFGKVLVEPRWTVQQKKEGYEPVNLDRSMNSESFAGNASQISHYVARGHKCLACSSPMPEFPADRPAPATCDRCLVEKVDLLSMATKADLARDALVARTEAKEKETSAMWNRCVGCQKVASLEDLDPCSNLTCDIFFRRTRSKIEMKRLYASLERFERPSKFMTITSASPMDIGGDTP